MASRSDMPSVKATIEVHYRIELDFGGADPKMSDWIDDLKAKEADKQQKADKEREWRLRNDKIIRVKGPELWATVIDRIHTDVAKLHESFPQDFARHIQIDPSGKSALGITLVKEAPPRMVLKAQWVDEINAVGLEIEEPNLPYPRKKELRCQVIADDSVQMEADGDWFSTAGPIAERLLRKLLLL